MSAARWVGCWAAVSLTVAACGRDAGGDHTALRLQAVADPVEAKAYRGLIAAFEAQRPDVQVEFIPVGRHPEHVTRLTTAFAAGNAPDLFLINFRRWGQFIASDVLEPVGPLLDEAGLLDERKRELWNAMQSCVSGRDGRVLAISIRGDGPVADPAQVGLPVLDGAGEQAAVLHLLVHGLMQRALIQRVPGRWGRGLVGHGQIRCGSPPGSVRGAWLMSQAPETACAGCGQPICQYPKPTDPDKSGRESGRE